MSIRSSDDRLVLVILGWFPTCLPFRFDPSPLIDFAITRHYLSEYLWDSSQASFTTKPQRFVCSLGSGLYVLQLKTILANGRETSSRVSPIILSSARFIGIFTLSAPRIFRNWEFLQQQTNLFSVLKYPGTHCNPS